MASESRELDDELDDWPKTDKEAVRNATAVRRLVNFTTRTLHR